MAIKDLLLVEAGTEVTWGTPVTPTVKLTGVKSISFTPDVKASRYDEMRGTLVPAYLASLEAVRGVGKMELVGTYEDVVYCLENICGVATPSGAGPYVRLLPMPLVAPVSPRIQTLVYGDTANGNTYAITGLIVTKIVFKLEAGKPLSVAIDFLGMQAITTATTVVLSDRATNVIMGQHALMYVDTWAGTVGTTAIATTAYTYTLTLSNKRDTNQYLGSLTPQNWHESQWDVECSIDWELNTTSKAWVDEILGGTTLHQRQIRMKATSGSAGTLKTLQLDTALMTEKAPEIWKDRNGVLLATIDYKGQYNTVLANVAAFSLTNGTAVVV